MTKCLVLGLLIFSLSSFGTCLHQASGVEKIVRSLSSTVRSPVCSEELVTKYQEAYKNLQIWKQSAGDQEVNAVSSCHSLLKIKDVSECVITCDMDDTESICATDNENLIEGILFTTETYDNCRMFLALTQESEDKYKNAWSFE